MSYNGPAVTCLTAVREMQGSNPIVGSLYVCHENHRDVQPWARAATLSAVPKSTQPSPSVRWSNGYQVAG